MSRATAAPELRDDAVAEPPEPDEASGRGTASRLRSVAGLILAPISIALAGFLLFLYINSYDKSFADESALRWETKLFPQLKRHLFLTGWSTVIVLLIAVPLGILLTRKAFRRLGGPVLAFASSGQAIPAYGLFILLFTGLGPSIKTSIIALSVFTLLPVLRNTMVGLEQVPEDVVESARGMGLTRMQALTRVELPLAVPIILAGVRTALVINVGTAALAFLVGGGGLGITINSGLKLNRPLVTFAGAAITALLALTVDWLAAVAERVLRPRGL
jgi:osmoprotectant transport system permease protein